MYAPGFRGLAVDAGGGRFFGMGINGASNSSMVRETLSSPWQPLLCNAREPPRRQMALAATRVPPQSNPAEAGRPLRAFRARLPRRRGGGKRGIDTATLKL